MKIGKYINEGGMRKLENSRNMKTEDTPCSGGGGGGGAMGAR